MGWKAEIPGLDPETARALQGKEALLQELGKSAAFQAARKKLGNTEELRLALERGDGEALRGAAGRLLQSPEGAALAEALKKALG